MNYYYVQDSEKKEKKSGGGGGGGGGRRDDRRGRSQRKKPGYMTQPDKDGVVFTLSVEYCPSKTAVLKVKEVSLFLYLGFKTNCGLDFLTELKTLSISADNRSPQKDDPVKISRAFTEEYGMREDLMIALTHIVSQKMGID